MSTELAAATDEFLLKALKVAKEQSNHNRSIACRDPKQWALCARHAFEGGNGDGKIKPFLDKHNISRWTYFAIRNQMQGTDGYEEQRELWAIETAVDVDLIGNAVRRTAEVLLDKLEDDDAVKELGIKEAAQAMQQAGRTHTMAVANYQKLTGAVTQTIVVEHKTTLDEAAAFAAKEADKVIEV